MRKLLKDSLGYVDYLVFAAFWVFYLYCQSYAWVELPCMSYFEQIELAELYMNGTMRFADLFTAYSEHGMFGTNLLMLLNIELFGLKTTFDIVFNAGIVAVFGGTCFWYMRKSLPDMSKRLCYYISVLCCGFFAFSVMQGSCSGMDLQVRLGMLFGFFATIAFDNYLRNNFSVKRFAIFAVFSLLYINVFGTLYCMATTAVILVVVVMRTITERKWDWKYLLAVAVSLLCWVLYYVQYPTVGVSTDTALKPDSGLGIVGTLVFYAQSLLIYTGSFVFGYDTIVDARISTNMYMMVGLLILLFVFWAAFRFFKTKQYEKTWLPLMLIGYAYAVFCMLILGRNDWGIEWFASSWYHVHTKAAVIGVIWILLQDAASNRKLYTGISMAFCAVMLLFGSMGVYFGLQRAPYVKIYLENKQPYLYVVDAEDMPVDANGMTPLDHNIDMTMKCLRILREYRLSVFSDPKNADRVYLGPSAVLGTGEYASAQGIWNDGWVTKLSEVVMKTGDQTQVIMKGYFPFEITGEQVITVTIGDKKTEYTIDSENIEIILDVPSNDIVTMNISCNFSYVNKPDVRELCFIFQGLEG